MNYEYFEKHKTVIQAGDEVELRGQWHRYKSHVFGQRNNDPIRRPNHFRIGTLEGAIKGALPYFEKAAICYASNPANTKGDATEIFQAIANLKELSGQ